MRSKRPARLLLLAVLALGLAAVLAAARPDKTKTSGAADDKPLIRKDLLTFGQAEIVPPRRDIFRPAFGAVRPAAAPARPFRRPAARKAPVPASTPAEAAPALNIIYVGSIRSAGSILALVVRNGQTITVAEGDEIMPGYKVLRVTPDQIEVEGPGADRKTFVRQGERP